ncbi:ABC transporter ATP-binding protein [Agromyces aerolatus]|uniref:ABC transporter ATP-binding protein n=1 Tax=Agromyces sp. LY-1074 TaxID=3074080 RepID=UPI0028663118|nr:MULTISPECIES: ABC transporter ATP-binding protein [unclassified Agromyces]MDR5701556.1 ABC transporter ATP-binding protein [Agromyces sp. LY-1074]MDR5707837.1 ABC transporter ATP-binding protein [Agromyces sp. LY-1358]
MSILEVNDLVVDIPTEAGDVHAVKGVSFEVEEGEFFGIVGESGSGKSVLVQSVMGLIPQARTGGSVRFQGEDLLRLSPDQLRRKRGKDISMIFQDPLSSLHPQYTVGWQIVEQIRAHEKVSKQAAKARAIELLEKVHIPDAASRFDAYPHQFSGGMRQRVMIAMSLSLGSALIIADEPTTALDSTVQAQILHLLGEMRQDFGATVLMISHDLGVMSSVADRVMVMHRGEQVEIGESAEVFERPQDPYTISLIESSSFTQSERGAALGRAEDEAPETIAEVTGVNLSFTQRGGRERKVLDDIDLQVRRGETLGLVGESGCGKTTLARTIAGLVQPSSGTVRFEGRDLSQIKGAEWRRLRQRVQVVFQDPFSSLNPKRRIGSIIGDPLRIHGVGKPRERQRRVQELIELVGLDPDHYNRFPSQFSGGQRQRIGIARAIALNPDLVILDEPVSALDVTVQAQVLRLLDDLQRELGLTYLFISHDLSVVKHMCDRIAVMEGGKIIELEDSETIYRSPREPFTKKLLAAAFLETQEVSS